MWKPKSIRNLKHCRKIGALEPVFVTLCHSNPTVHKVERTTQEWKEGDKTVVDLSLDTPPGYKITSGACLLPIIMLQTNNYLDYNVSQLVLFADDTLTIDELKSFVFET